METLESKIDKVSSLLTEKISEAVADGEFTALEEFGKTGQFLSKIKTQLKQIDDDLNALSEGLKSNAGAIAKEHVPTLRKFRLSVTQGMINQNLLTFTYPLKAGTVKHGEKLKIKCEPSQLEFESEIMYTGNKLRERGRIGKFYQRAGVKSGDLVCLEEIEPGSWKLYKFVEGGA